MIPARAGSGAGRPGDRSGDRSLVLLLVVVGVAVRLFFSPPIAEFHAMGEATYIALAVAAKGSFADPFFRGQGPSAHMMPLSPLIAGGVFRLFGPEKPAANAVLFAWSLLQSFGAILLLSAAARKAGASRVAWAMALVILLLLPTFAQQEIIDYRYWEGALALCLSAINLWLMLGEAPAQWRRPRLIGAGALAALLFFVSPPCGLAVVLCWASVARAHLNARQSATLAVAAALSLACLIGPWALRNERTLGHPVLLRDDFGLEFAIANNDTALGDRPDQAFDARMRAMHPYVAKPGRAAMRAAGGEIAYAQRLGATTWDWVRQHPAGFTRLCMLHLSEFFFPRTWQIKLGWEGLATFRAITIGLMDGIGLLALAIGLARRQRRSVQFAIFVGVTALPYMLVQPVMRYTHLVYPLLCFLACQLICEVLGVLRDRLRALLAAARPRALGAFGRRNPIADAPQTL